MYRFTYARGEWTEGNSLPEWKDDEDFSAYLERIDHSSSKINIGSEHGSSIEIYESSRSETFLADVCPSGNATYQVLIKDFPSLMIFMKEFGPAFSSINAETNYREILDLLEKMFRVYHGHGATQICQECDPSGWEESVKFAEARAKRRSVA